MLSTSQKWTNECLICLENKKDFLTKRGIFETKKPDYFHEFVFVKKEEVKRYFL